ncbi:LIC10906 family membrane protein [Leptospira santarosai]|uniref:Putative membrane protein n=1 Tax=Leptospira santarosai serovar Arenal str. MAVJ 401 TaxID=1049976 RepID=M6JLG1_9LEPT|nr:putative membrane protein [Leptospira santarosai]EMN22531.1 putative membrane protein [Leptospira santarosai serovar Arenal str. MAVJ 401]
MNFSNYLCIGTSLYIFFMGMYIYKFPDRKKVQGYFLALAGSFSIWISFFVIRQYVTYDYRHYVLDWMLIPTIFFPIFLIRIVSLISNPNHKLPGWQIGIIWIFVLYFLWAAISCSFSVLIDKFNYKYTPTIHYHALIGYQVGFIGYCILKLMRSIVQFPGEQRVRLTLIAFGIFSVLFFALIFIYILPLLGFFYGFLSSIGALISVSLWAVAILQYNVFEIKIAVHEGQYVPILNRLSLNFYMSLFKILDPMGFKYSNFLYKRTCSLKFLCTDLRLRAGLKTACTFEL